MSCNYTRYKTKGRTFLPFLIHSTNKLKAWLEVNQYQGYDPADGLTSYLRPLTLRNLFLERLLQQLVWKSPFNLRPFLGVGKHDSNIARGYIARGYLRMFTYDGNPDQKGKAIKCLEWLIGHRAPGFADFCWGKVFDFVSRAGRQRQFEPNTIWSSLIGQAFLDGYDILNDTRYLEVADSICQWISKLPKTFSASGYCINYTPYQNGDCTIHNQSMQAAALLARCGKATSNSHYLSMAHEAILFTCSRQRPDGSWHYGESPSFRWIDNFHTAYNLDALKSYIDLTRDKTFEVHLYKGFDFYKRAFIEPSGRPKYFHDRTYPIDSQCAAQAIETLAYFSDNDRAALDLACRVAKWTIMNMQDNTGYFYFMRYPGLILKTPMIHWAQAVTFKAMTDLIHCLTREYQNCSITE